MMEARFRQLVPSGSPYEPRLGISRAVRAWRVRGEFLGDIRPANRVMQVGRFIDPKWLVEIEAGAVIEA